MCTTTSRDLRLSPLVIGVLAATFAIGCSGSSETPAPGQDAPPIGDRATEAGVEVPRADGGVARSGASRPATTPAPPVIAAPTSASAGAPTCAVGEPSEIYEGGKRLQSLEVGFGPRGGLVAWPRSKNEVALVPLNSVGEAAGRVAWVEMPGARHVHGIERLGESFAVLTHDLCPDEEYFFKCVHAQAFGTTGKPLGETVTEVTKEWIREEFHERIGPGEIWLLRSHMYVPPVIDSLAAGEDGNLEIGVVHVLGGEQDLSWARGFAVHGRDWFAIVESEQGEWTLVSHDAPRRSLPWLPTDSRVLALEWVDGGLTLLFAPLLGSGGTGRPRVAQLGESGKLKARPRKIGKGEPLPAPFAERVEAVLEKQGKNLVFGRQDAAGDAIGEAAVIAPFPRGGRDDPQLALGWTGSRFVAVWSSFEDQQWKIYSAAITCGKASPPVGGSRPAEAN